MPYRHLIRLFADDRSQWLAQDRGGRVLAGPVDGLPGEAAEETVVLVPSSAVLVLPAPRVARQRRQLEQAVGFAVEEQLVAPVEQAHVAIIDDSGPESVAVAVVARAQLEAWLSRLAEHGVVPDRLLPEALLLAHEPQPTLLLDGNSATLRYADTGWLSGTVSEVPAWLALLQDQGDDREIAVVSDAAPAAPDLDVAAASTSRVDIWHWLAQRVAALPAEGFNLLTGPYTAPRRRDAGLRVWRAAAVLALGAGLLTIGSMALERWQLDRQHAHQRAQMELLLREALPDVQRIVDPRAQMLGELSRRRGQATGSGALAMLSRIAPLLAGSGRYTPQALEFRGGTLELTLRSPDVATLDELRARITTLGFSAELSSVTPGSSGVEGILRVRGGGA